MSTPLLGQFLVAINGFLKAGNAQSLNDYIALEPPFNQQYDGMIQELRRSHPKGQEEVLEKKCQQFLSAASDEWTNFVRFMVQYFVYLRDISQDQSEYLSTYERLLELQTKANSALSQGDHGNLLLQTVITNAKLLCRLAIGLDKQPDLIAHLKSAGPRGDDGGQRETLPERAANTVRTAFVTCLNDRSDMIGGRPQGRQPGIYVLANLCLKILFQCRKTRNATQIFENISNAAPPLSAYPASQRVTYLYYLGRFLFQNNHFYRAQLALQTAYDEAPATPRVTKQRRLILVYLTTSNIILGRFPSNDLLDRPEAHGFHEHLIPLCHIIRYGNLHAFEQYFALHGPHTSWLMRFRIFFQLRDRCEVLVWRSLLRKVFQMKGFRPGGESRSAATLDLNDAITAFVATQSATSSYVDPDIAGNEEFISADYQDVALTAIESKVSSLIEQAFISGYIAHDKQKLAILGTKQAGGDAVKAGFPNVWSVIKANAKDTVPGWKKTVNSTGGMVFNLSNVRGIGAG